MSPTPSSSSLSQFLDNRSREGTMNPSSAVKKNEKGRGEKMTQMTQIFLALKPQYVFLFGPNPQTFHDG